MAKGEVAERRGLEFRKVDVEWSRDLCKEGNRIVIDGDLACDLVDDGTGAIQVTVIFPVKAGGDTWGRDAVVSKVKKHEWEYKSKPWENRCLADCGDDDDDE